MLMCYAYSRKHDNKMAGDEDDGMKMTVVQQGQTNGACQAS